MNATAKNADFGGSAETTAVATLAAISVAHFLNDMIQSVLPAIYPLLKESFALDFVEIGAITLVFQITASLLQPLVGLYTDRYPRPYSLTVGMGLSLTGLVIIANAPTYPVLIAGAAILGSGSAVFHPNPRGWRASPRADATASPSRSSRSAAMSAPRSGRWSPPSSSCPTGSRRSPGSRSPRSSA